MTNRGLSLVETIAALAILLLLSSAVAGFTHGILNTHDTQVTLDLGHELVLSLMDEIVPLPFEDRLPIAGAIGPEAGEWAAPHTRVDFDDVDDYSVWALGLPVQSKAGAALPYPGWTRSVTITFLPTDDGTDTNVKRIRVIAYKDGDVVSEIETLRVRGGRHVDFVG